MGTVLVSFLETVGRGDGIYGPVVAKVRGRVSIIRVVGWGAGVVFEVRGKWPTQLAPFPKVSFF